MIRFQSELRRLDRRPWRRPQRIDARPAIENRGDVAPFVKYGDPHVFVLDRGATAPLISYLRHLLSHLNPDIVGSDLPRALDLHGQQTVLAELAAIFVQEYRHHVTDHDGSTPCRAR